MPKAARKVFLENFRSMLMPFAKIATSPKIKVALMIFAPRTLPREKAGISFQAELMPTKSSGIEVAKLTRKNAIKYSETFKSRASEVRDFTKLPPAQLKIKNETMKTKKSSIVLF